MNFGLDDIINNTFLGIPLTEIEKLTHEFSLNKGHDGIYENFRNV